MFKKVQISLKDALTKNFLEFKNIDGRMHRVSLDSIVNPDSVLKLENMGLKMAYKGRENSK